MPPESRTPTGTSAIKCARTESLESHRQLLGELALVLPAQIGRVAGARTGIRLDLDSIGSVGVPDQGASGGQLPHVTEDRKRSRNEAERERRGRSRATSSGRRGEP